LVFFPDYVKALGISDDDVQFQTTDHSGSLVFNLLTHETWVETESASISLVDAPVTTDNSPNGSSSPASFTAFNTDDDAKLC
jgi:hypothetical protein